MKYLFSLCVAVIWHYTCICQIKLPVNTAFRSDIQKVFKDYPDQFSNTKGDVRSNNPQTVEYLSNIIPSGAEDAYVMQYSALGKSIYSWHTTILTTENFKEASDKYKWLYQQLKGMNVTYVTDQYTLEGKYQQPDESIGFVTSVFTLAHPPSPLKKMKVEISMNFEFPEWKVALAIFEKEREDDERGDIIEQ